MNIIYNDKCYKSFKKNKQTNKQTNKKYAATYKYKFFDGVCLLLNEDALSKSLFHTLFSILLKHENNLPDHNLNNPLG